MLVKRFYIVCIYRFSNIIYAPALTAATAVGRFPYPVNITILLSFLDLCKAFTTSKPLPSSKPKINYCKVSWCFIGYSKAFFNTFSFCNLKPFLSIALASLLLNGSSSSSIKRDLSSKSEIFNADGWNCISHSITYMVMN